MDLTKHKICALLSTVLATASVVLAYAGSDRPHFGPDFEADGYIITSDGKPTANSYGWSGETTWVECLCCEATFAVPQGTPCEPICKNAGGSPPECSDFSAGACCMSSKCEEKSKDECRSDGGTFGGAGTLCDDFGATCVDDKGSCDEMNICEGIKRSGAYFHGDKTECGKEATACCDNLIGEMPCEIDDIDDTTEFEGDLVTEVDWHTYTIPAADCNELSAYLNSLSASTNLLYQAVTAEEQSELEPDLVGVTFPIFTIRAKTLKIKADYCNYNDADQKQWVAKIKPTKLALIWNNKVYAPKVPNSTSPGINKWVNDVAKHESGHVSDNVQLFVDLINQGLSDELDEALQAEGCGSTRSKAIKAAKKHLKEVMDDLIAELIDQLQEKVDAFHESHGSTISLDCSNG